MEFNFDDIVVYKDVFGDEHRARVLWKKGHDGLWVKSVDDKHRKAFTLNRAKVVRNEGRAK